MKKSEICAALRQHSKTHLTPTKGERETVTAIYAAIQAALGADKTLQIGSYARLTSITPLHDLDVLYIIGIANEAVKHPEIALGDAEEQLRSNFVNPTKWRFEIAPQTHSVTITFFNGREEVLSIDIVPALISGRNEFGQDTYKVPEIIQRSHAARRLEYKRLAEAHQDVSWIPSDPRGYIEIARQINERNEDLRKSVKIVKAWHYACKGAFDSPLKSFHIEQAITRQFQSGNPDIFDAIFQFFFDLPALIKRPQFRDRADDDRFIDDYVTTIGFPEQRTLKEARDGFLIRLEDFAPTQSVDQLLSVYLRERKSLSETYLFDMGIKTFTEYPLSIVATVLERTGGFRKYILDEDGEIKIDRKIEFRVGKNVAQADYYKWKVKNDDASPQPRGEITDYRTLNDPERTSYSGSHYVECYAIQNNTCIARGRQDIRLRTNR